MKRIFGFFLTALLLLSAVPSAQAAGQGRCDRTQPACTREDQNRICDSRREACGNAFADENQDGVCDNRREDCGRAFVDENGDGLCDNRQENCGKAFANENNDGVCHNRQTQPARQGHHGQGHGRRS